MSRFPCLDSRVTLFPSLGVKLFKLIVSSLSRSEKTYIHRTRDSQDVLVAVLPRAVGEEQWLSSRCEMCYRKPVLSIHVNFSSQKHTEISSRQMLNKYSVMYLVVHFFSSDMSRPFFSLTEVGKWRRPPVEGNYLPFYNIYGWWSRVFHMSPEQERCAYRSLLKIKPTPPHPTLADTDSDA